MVVVDAPGGWRRWRTASGRGLGANLICGSLLDFVPCAILADVREAAACHRIPAALHPDLLHSIPSSQLITSVKRMNLSTPVPRRAMFKRQCKQQR